MIAATCRKRGCVTCGAYWRLRTHDRFGYHLHNHDGQLYADTVSDWDWPAVSKDMRRRAKALGLPLRYVAIRDADDSFRVIASVQVRPDVAGPVELPEALSLLEAALDDASPDPRRPSP